MAKRKVVLFLCTGNSARSQMAEAFLRKYAGDYFEVFSAGLHPSGINAYTFKVMAELNISLEGHTSDGLSQYIKSTSFDILITVCAHAERDCPRALLGESHFFWDFEDPTALVGSEEETLQKFRDVRDQIDQRVKAWLTANNIPISM